MKAKSKQKKSKAAEWRIARTGVRYTVKKGRRAALKEDGTVRTFRTRDAANRVARELNRT
jgi:hypothetical protein